MIVTFSGACGIKDEDSLIITGGGWENPNGEITATKLVDRYNSKVNALFQFLHKLRLNQIQLFHHFIFIRYS